MTKFSPVHVGNNIIRRALDEQIPVTVMKLQRLLYFTAAEHAKITGETMLYEQFRKWSYGPVMRSVQDKFANHADRPIGQLVGDAVGDTYRIDEASYPEVGIAIGRVWRLGRHMSPVSLSRITQTAGSAWYQAHVAGASTIDDGDIIRDETYREILGIL